MPKNRWIYWGVVVLVATALLWIGAELTKRIEWILPYTAGVAVLMIVGGFVYEWWRSGQMGPPPATKSNEPPAITGPGPDKPAGSAPV
jgi:hypothetical protein